MTINKQLQNKTKQNKIKKLDYRNLPQIIVQVLYASGGGNIDVFVGSAMLFSILSVIFSIFQQISRKIKYDHRQLINGEKQSFKMDIECSKFKKHHKYTHNLIATTLMSVL